MALAPQLVRRILWVLFIICLLVLARYILFKNPPHYYKAFFTGEHNKEVIMSGWKKSNLTPFETIRLYYRRGVRSIDMYKNIGGNILGFVPLGILLPLLFVSLRSWWKTTLTIFIISVLFETTQLITGWGFFDVDDMILNTTGGLIGYILFFLGRIVFLADTHAPIKSG
jgi:glycopeptide antibiotics resistance protein